MNAQQNQAQHQKHAIQTSMSHDPRLTLQQQFLMQERIKQQQDQLQKQRENRGKQLQAADNRTRKESASKQILGMKHDTLPPSPNLNLNHEQEMKLVELKKQRESLKKPLNKDSKMVLNEPSTIDDLPMHELLGADPEPRRLGKRPRLDCNTEISTEVR